MAEDAVSIRRDDFLSSWGKYPEAPELLQAREAMLEKPAYADYVRFLCEKAEGYNPLPDLRLAPYRPFLDAVGHDFAVYEVCTPASWFRQLFLGGTVFRENYHTLQGSVIARLLQGRGPVVLGFEDIQVLYSTIDRMLRGSRNWTETCRVPPVNKQFYQTLRRVKYPILQRISPLLNAVIRIKGVKQYGEKYKNICTAGQAAQDMIIAATALKNGHMRVTAEDEAHQKPGQPGNYQPHETRAKQASGQNSMRRPHAANNGLVDPCSPHGRAQVAPHQRQVGYGPDAGCRQKRANPGQCLRLAG